MTKLDVIINALKNLGGQGVYADIYNQCGMIYGHTLTDVEKASIRKAIEDNSSDSKNYKGKNDIFYSVNGIGKGKWGLRNFKASKNC